MSKPMLGPEAIADLRNERDDLERKCMRMRLAIHAAYYAAWWIPDRECQAAMLWTELRDAAGIPPGKALEKLGPQRMPAREVAERGQ